MSAALRRDRETARARAPSRTERYTHIPTIEVLRGLAREGFTPFMVCQSRTRDAENREFTKHIVRMRQAGSIQAREANEIILINSHNGASAYQLICGVFRQVCTNGLVAGDVHEDIRIRHNGIILDDVIEGAFRVVANFERVDASREAIQVMQVIRLSALQQLAFAREALALRFDDENGTKAPPVSETQVIEPRRAEDPGDDLWRVFNRSQENLTRGGLAGRTARGRNPRTRAVTGIDQNVKLNRALWVLAEEMRRLVG